MTLKERHRVPDGGFVFKMKLDRILEEIESDSLSQLTERVMLTLEARGVDVPENIEQVIEHQICMRQEDPAKTCWSGGIGDDLHHKWVKPFMSALAKGLDASGVPVIKEVSKQIKKIGKCEGCSGSTVFEPEKNNLGRAGTLNNIQNLFK